MNLSWDVIEGGFEDTAVVELTAENAELTAEVDAAIERMLTQLAEIEPEVELTPEHVELTTEVDAAIERMLTVLAVRELDWRLEKIATETPSWAMQWLIENARIELFNGDLSVTLLWVRRAFFLAWSRKEVRKELDICVDLIYRIMPPTVQTKRNEPWLFVSESMATWSALPTVRTQARLLESQLAGIIPAIEAVYKRTRQPEVRMYAHYFVLEWGVTPSLEYLMNIEFIAAYRSRASVHAIITNAVQGLW